MTEWHIYVIAVAAWLLSYIKVPYKKLTERLIRDAAARKRANKLIILLPLLFGFIGVCIDMLIFGWNEEGSITALIHPTVSAAGISTIIYNAAEKFFTGKASTDYDGLAKLLIGAGSGDGNTVKKILDDCLTADEAEKQPEAENKKNN